MSCKNVKSEEVAEAYVLGTLDEDVREAYEQHIFDCSKCLDDLESLQAIQHELAASRKDIEAAVAPRRLRPTSTWALRLVAAAVVIGVTALLVGPLKSTRHTQVVSAEFAELAHIEPAPYTPVMLRGVADESVEVFQEAMGHYMNEDYDSAAEGLRSAAELNPESPKIGFYLGVSLLLSGNTGGAIESLGKTIALGDTLYLEIAHFYLSKAHLLAGDVEAARGELMKTRELRGDLESEAERLLGLFPAPGG